MTGDETPSRQRYCESRTWNDYAQVQLSFLESQPRLKAAYWSVDDPIRHFGLPLGPVTETPNGIQLKTNYASFQISKRDTPFAKTGDLTVSNAGDLILDAESSRAEYSSRSRSSPTKRSRW